MASTSTTIRVSEAQRDRLRELARQRSATMTETLDAALESLRRELFYQGMAKAESEARADRDSWARFVAERDAWLNADLR